MKEKITLEGRSLVFNIAFVVLNLTGLSFLIMGYHDAFEEQSTLFKTIGYMMMMMTITGLVIFKGRLMMASVSRVLVGGLFIVSGLVKANDPIGFSYKLEEYFEDGALAYRIKEMFGAPGFSMEALMEHALLLSILICIAEIVLGVLTIIGGKIKLVSYLMMLMMVFFTFLTWHTSTCDHETKFKDHDTYNLSLADESALANIKLEEIDRQKEEAKLAKKEGRKFEKTMWLVSESKEEIVVAEMKAPQCVDDCGCFGDAMKGSVGRSLTPKESLWKDIVLLYLVFWIFAAQWIIKPNTRKENMVYVPASLVVVTFFSWIFGWYFPIIFAVTSIVGALWILRVGRKVLGNYWGSALIVSILCVLMVGYVMMYNPIKDYRPYAVGSDLIEKMNDGVEGEYLNMLRYKNTKTGEEKEFDASSPEYTESKIWEDSDWVYVDMVQKAIVESVNPTIMDFRPMISVQDLSELEENIDFVKNIIDTSVVQAIRVKDMYYDSIMEIPLAEFYPEDYEGEDYQVMDTVALPNPDFTDVEVADAILAQDKIAIIVSKNLDDGSWGNKKKLLAIMKECEKKNVPFIMICNASREDINAFRKKNKFDVPTFAMDEIELKIISRSNPTLMVLEKGVVKGKYPFRSTPSVDNFRTEHLK